MKDKKQKPRDDEAARVRRDALRATLHKGHSLKALSHIVEDDLVRGRRSATRNLLYNLAHFWLTF
jgi:hypothetical protein